MSAPKTISEPMSAGATIKIMLLDDDPFMLRLLERMLGQLGITPVATYDSAEFRR
jgi:hypothetical protein